MSHFRIIRRLSVMPAYRIVFQVEGNDDKDLSFDE